MGSQRLCATKTRTYRSAEALRALEVNSAGTLKSKSLSTRLLTLATCIDLSRINPKSKQELLFEDRWKPEVPRRGWIHSPVPTSRSGPKVAWRVGGWNVEGTKISRNRQPCWPIFVETTVFLCSVQEQIIPDRLRQPRPLKVVWPVVPGSEFLG